MVGCVPRVHAGAAIGRDSTATYGGCLGSCNQPIRIDPPITDMPSLSEGDGFEPLIVANNSKVFTLNHHVDSTARATSATISRL